MLDKLHLWIAQKNDSWVWFTHGNQTLHKFVDDFFRVARDMEKYKGGKDKSKKQNSLPIKQ